MGILGLYWGRVWSSSSVSGPAAGLSRALGFEAAALRAERQLPVGHHLVRLILQQARHVGVGNAVMVTAEADVVLLQLNGPERGVEFAVLVLPVHVDPSHEAQQQHHHQDDDGKDDDVELLPGHLRQGRGGVVRGAAHAAQQGLGGGCRAQRRAEGADGAGHGWDSCSAHTGAAGRGERTRLGGLCCRSGC